LVGGGGDLDIGRGGGGTMRKPGGHEKKKVNGRCSKKRGLPKTYRF